MNTTENRHYRSLELDKILEMLAAYATCADAKALALALTPQTDLSLARALLQQTEDAHMLLARFGGPSFGGLHNVSNALQRAAAGGMLTMRELLEIAEVLRVIRSLSEWRARSASVATCLDNFFQALMPNKFLEERITNAILSEEEMADSASPTLQDIRRKIRAASSRVRDRLDQMIRSPHYQKFLQEPIVTQRNGRFVVPVKNESRSEVPGLVHDTSSSGATVFVEPMGVVEANNEIKVLQSKERDEMDRILTELSNEAGSFADTIKASYECAVELNLIFAKAHLAYEMKAAPPLLNEDGIIELRRARHPLIAKEKVVPTDIRLGGEFDTLVITGPNTGGKTVSIKTIGLLTLMAMCGLMLPVADQSRVSVFTHVLADIGDEQSIEQSLSTFSAHMTNIIDILRQADEHSLVLIDELGAGTDPVEGAALAMAILERLHLQGAKVAATTHYAELKAYALQTPRVENGCCEFDVATLRPTYRLLTGVPGRSNAFAISERLGMERTVVERARELVSAENTRFEDVVESLEQSHQALEQERVQAYAVRAEAEGLRQKAQQQLEMVDQLREKELEQARAQAARIVEQARRESQAFLMELEKLKKEKEKNQNLAELARRAKSQMKQHANAMAEVTNPVVAPILDDEDYTLPRPLKIGDTVLLADLNKQAIVLALPDRNGNVEVQAGPLKTRVKLQNLRLLGAKERKRTQSSGRSIRRSEGMAHASVKTSCDLRGKTVEEALLDLEQFLDNCVMARFHECTVIHGKGTGALRSAVQTHLRTHPAVKSYRLGVYGEGEDGVTIITLK